MSLVPLTEIISTLESGSRPKGGIKDIASGIPSLGAEHLTDDGGFKLNKLKLIPFSFYESMKNGKIKYGDILIVKDGATTGKVSFVNSSFPYNDASINEHLFQLKIDQDKAFSPYIFRYLHSDLGKKQILQDFRGATVGGISRGFVDKVIVPLPPLPEQKRIAAILDKADTIRRKRQLTIKKSEDFLRSVFLDMFGDPVTNPKGWDVIPFGKVVENKDSLRIPLKETDRDNRDGPYPYYGSVGIIDYLDSYIFEGEHLLISEDGKHLESRNRPIACIATGKFWVNNHSHVLSNNGKTDLYYLAKHMEMRPIRQFVTGIDQFKLNRSNLDRIPIPVPPMEIQCKFRAIQDLLIESDSRKKSMLQRANKLFFSLTQLAFRGELTNQAADELLKETVVG